MLFFILTLQLLSSTLFRMTWKYVLNQLITYYKCNSECSGKSCVTSLLSSATSQTHLTTAVATPTGNCTSCCGQRGSLYNRRGSWFFSRVGGRVAQMARWRVRPPHGVAYHSVPSNPMPKFLWWCRNSERGRSGHVSCIQIQPVKLLRCHYCATLDKNEILIIFLKNFFQVFLVKL